MWNFAIYFLVLYPLPKAPSEPIKALEGSWNVTANRHAGQLIINVGKFDTIEGSVFGNPIKGTFDSKTKQVVIERMIREKNDHLKVVQVFTGTLTESADAKLPRYSLKGTFEGIGGDWGNPGVKYSWDAAIALPGRSISEPRP
jgi:hypothetical protein